MTDPTCVSCRYWKPDVSVLGKGWCRRVGGDDRRPPSDYWCGEHPAIVMWLEWKKTQARGADPDGPGLFTGRYSAD